jgi:hypothetical protein
MLNRRSVFLLIAVVFACSIIGGARYYDCRCHGVDACAAADAESHELTQRTTINRL